MSQFEHPIQVVARRTGLSQHVLRVWEKRYAAVEPDRTDTNRRLYSDEQIRRLTLLRQVTEAGQSIGVVASLPTERLEEMAAADPGVETSSPTLPVGVPGVSAEGLIEAGLAAVRTFDAAGLESALQQGEVALGTLGMLQRVAAPLAQAIGAIWRDGGITAAHEHFASSVLRTHLAQLARPFAAGPDTPVLVVGTPAGQLHELGALLVAAVGGTAGWRVTYLGASLPAPELAGAVRQNRARAVALSVVYPADDPRLEAEFLRLRELLPADVKVIVGGQAMAAYRDVLDRIGAHQSTDLGQFGALLDRFRMLPAATSTATTT